ncbi:PAS domain S-box protein [Candidatus Poribacteria bacterium]|nr:PAS domain S-box protein [Candidatus Poribacteria bacterium]
MTKENNFDEEKTKEQRLNDLQERRQQLTALETVTNQPKPTEARLWEAEEMYRTLVKISPEAVTITNLDGNIIDISQRTLKLHGFKSAEELLGRSAFELIAEEDREKALINLQRTLKEELVENLEYTLLRKNGTRFSGELNASVLKDADGKPKAFIATTRDITKRKKVEAVLRESEEKYRLVVENANEAIIVVQDGLLKFVNPQTIEIMGYSRDELTSRPFVDFIHPADREMVVERHLRRLKGEELNHVYPFKIIDQAGNVKWVEINAVLITWDGRPATLNFLSVITERKQAEEELHYRVELEALVTTISTNFINLPLDEIDDGIKQALQKIGAFSAVDRSYVFLFSADGTKMDNTHEWCAEGIEPQIDNLKGLPIEVFPWWMEKLKRFENIYVPRVADLSSEASAEKELLQTQDIKSLLVVPLAHSGSLLGFLGFDAVRLEKTWSEDIIVLLRITGEIFANALARKRIEKALQESEERYKTLVENVNIGVYRNTGVPPGRFLQANPAIARMHGYDSVEEFMEVSVSELYQNPEDRKHFVEKIKTQGFVKNEELQLKKKDGTRIWASCTARVEYDAHGDIKWIDGAIEDITARKQAEEALRRAYEELERRVEERTAELSQANALLRKEVEERKRAEDALRRALAETKQRQAEVYALLTGARAVLQYREFGDAARVIFDTCKNLIGSAAGYVALSTPDGAANEVFFLDAGGLPCSVDPTLPMPIRGLRGEAYHTGKTVFHNNFSTSEWQKYMPEGHVNLDNVMFAPLIIAGKVVGLLGLANKPGGFTDNDARMASAFGELAAIALHNNRILATLENSEERFRRTVEHSGDGIVLTDEQGRIFLWNRAAEQIFGLKEEEVLDRFLWDIQFQFAPDDRKTQKDYEMLRTILLNLLKTGQGDFLNRLSEQKLQRPDGTRSIVQTIAFSIPTGKGFFLGSVNRDITAPKQAQELLQESHRRLQETLSDLDKKNRELESFVYTVSHDLKAPLISLEGFASILLGNYKDRALDEVGQLYLSRIQANVQKMGNLIQNLLELSRIGRIVHDYETVDVTQIIKEAIEMLQTQLAERGTALVIQADLPTITGERVRIKQVFENLVSNANKFMGDDNDKPRIEIGCHDNGDFCEFFVQDNGIGIQKEYHEKVFEIFTRLGDVEVEGTGVGLAIVRRIVETHGGNIWLDSEVGKGTTVYFTLPKSSQRNSDN